MKRAITWVMGSPNGAVRYVLLDHVVVAVDAAADMARAHAFTSQGQAHAAAIRQTQMDEAHGYHLRGPVLMIKTNVSPEKIAAKYRTQQTLGPGLRTIMRKVAQGPAVELS